VLKEESNRIESMESLNGGVTSSSSSSKSEEEEKAASSYTYWVRNKTEAAAPLPVPQKLQQSSESESPHQLGSAWNRAGTWEEKSLNHWAIPRIKVNLLTCYYLHRLNYSFIQQLFFVSGIAHFCGLHIILLCQRHSSS